MFFRNLDDKVWFKKCKSIILNFEHENPFPKPPIATNLYNNPPIFCYGRDEYVNEILHEIKEGIKSPEPNLIRIVGKQGIGKSTVICWAVKELEKNYKIPVVYLETSAQPEDFKMKSLYRQIISKIEKSEIINILLFNTISKFIEIFKESGGKLYQQLSTKFSGEEIGKLIGDSEYTLNKITDPTFNQKIFDLLKDNLILIKDYIPFDLNFLLIFWKAHVQNPKIIEASNAYRGNYSYDGYCIQTDNDASINIDKIIKVFRWAFNNKTTLLLVFDHLEAGISKQKESVYSNLFSLLLNLRHKEFLTIIISGTLDAYSAFDDVLQEDQRLQLDNWSKTLALTNLNPQNVIQIIGKYLSIFWSGFNYEPPPKNALFPFGENSLKYLYENNGLDLRKTLKNLYELIENYRKNESLEYIDSFFKAFKAFRKREDVALSYIEQKEFQKMLLDSKIQDKRRSTMVELAICKLFEPLKSHSDYPYLTDVKHEPPLGISGKKPDIFLEFFGNEGPKSLKKLGIEVKIYRKSDHISKGEINKTYLLLQENALDYIIWITNVPLDIKYRYDSVSEELNEHIGRISPLDDLELAYLSFMVYFENIFDREPKIEEIEFILNKLNLSPIKLKEVLRDLVKITEISVPTEKEDITMFVEPKGIKTEIPSRTKRLMTKKPEKLSVEIGQEEIRIAVENYIEKKSKTNKQVTSHYTIRAIRKSLNLKDDDKILDEDIWSVALNIAKSHHFKSTPKTIYL